MSTTTKSTKSTKSTGTKSDEQIALEQNSAAAAAKQPQPLTAAEQTAAERDSRIAALAKPHLRGIGSATKVLRDAASAVRDGTLALGFARVQWGTAVLPVYLGLTDEKGSFRWKSSSAVDHLVATYLSGETDERGKPYAASTVQAWLTAAEQEALLPAEHRGKFGSDAHRTFARVRKSKGPKQMVTFANGLARKGDVSVGKVRAAYDAKFPADPKPEITPASEAAAIQTDEMETAAILRTGIAKLGLDPKVLHGLLIAAAYLGQRHPDADPESISIALTFLAKQPTERKARTKRSAK